MDTRTRPAMSEELSDEKQEVDAQIRRMEAFFRVNIPIVIGGLLLASGLKFFFNLQFLLALVGVLSVDLVLILWARGQARRQRIGRAVAAISTGLWIFVLTMAWTVPPVMPVTIMLTILPILLVLPFVSARHLKQVMIASTLVAVAVAFMSLHRSEELAPIPRVVIDIVLLVAVPVVVAILSIVVWQYGQRLNDSIQKLRFANQALRSTEKNLEGSVRERTRELQGARDQALAGSRAKSAFLANMSHELRTPLNAILGYSEMLQEEATEGGRPDFVPDLQKIHGAGKHLLALINDVLDLSKIEAGKMTLSVEAFNVPELVDEVIAVAQPLARPGVKLAVTCTDQVGEASADVTKLRQALFNLLSNACKFTEQGTVTLAVSTMTIGGKQQLAFKVNDTGIGMSKEELGRIFQPFLQGNTATQKKYGGTGLGLALSRRFCQIMGGDITVASEAGKGSTFTIVLPTVVVPMTASIISSMPVDWERRVKTMPPPGRVGGKVLVVDDDAPTRELILRFLEKDGHTVHLAADGEEGLRLAKQLRPDVITLDVMMPRMDGWGMLAGMRADPTLVDIPVILLTVVDQTEQALASGATELLTKPINRERLSAAIGKYTQRGMPMPGRAPASTSASASASGRPATSLAPGMSPPLSTPSPTPPSSEPPPAKG